MTFAVHAVLVALALICFLLAGLEIIGPETQHVPIRRLNFQAAGLFFWLLSTLVGGR